MRIAVLSDIHGNLDALNAVLKDLEARGGADRVWVLGDLAAFGPEPAGTLRRLRAIDNAEFIYGNTDRYLTTGRRPAMAAPDEDAWEHMVETLRAREGGFAWTVERLDYAAYTFLRDLPPELATDVPGFGWVVAFHAAPGDDERKLVPETPADVVADALLDREGRLALHGHTHLPTDRQVDGWRVVNPGSVGIPFDGDHRAAYALLEFDETGDLEVTFCRAEYDYEAVVGKLRADGASNIEWVIGLLETARPPG